MSIALAILSGSATVVASDGRAVEHRALKTDCHSKIFSLFGDSILGTYTGLMEFDGWTIDKHIRHILVQECACRPHLGEAANISVSYFSSLMPGIQYSKSDIDIILADRNELYGIRLRRYDNGQLDCRIELHNDQPGGYCIYGVDPARDAAKKYISGCGALAKERCRRLERIAVAAIQEGIKHSGPHPDAPGIDACGGKIYVKCTTKR